MVWTGIAGTSAVGIAMCCSEEAARLQVRVLLAWVVVGEAEIKSLLVFENVVESKAESNAGCEGFSH